MNSSEIMQAANPVDDTAFAEAWADAVGQAAFERIIAEDRSVPARRRRYRRRFALGAAIAAAAGFAIALIGVPGSDHGGTASAWSISANADGSLTVKFSDYRDPAGLQARLRDTGLRANVRTLTAHCAATRTTYQQFQMSFDSSISSANFGRFLGIPQPTAARIGKPTPPSAPATPKLGQLPSAPSAPSPSSPAPATPHVVSSLTIHPQYLPTAATLWIGFPAENASNAGHLLTVTVASTRSGTPACFS